MKRVIMLAILAALVIGACGGAEVAKSDGPPPVRQNDYRLYQIPGGKTIVCIGWGSSSSSSGKVSSAISCDWDHPLDK